MVFPLPPLKPKRHEGGAHEQLLSAPAKRANGIMILRLSLCIDDYLRGMRPFDNSTLKLGHAEFHRVGYIVYVCRDWSGIYARSYGILTPAVFESSVSKLRTLWNSAAANLTTTRDQREIQRAKPLCEACWTSVQQDNPSPHRQTIRANALTLPNTPGRIADGGGRPGTLLATHFE